MIKKVEIKNFQSHKNTVVTFDKGMNVIIGSSDNGKTTIIRALQWVLYNKPTGDAFRSNWGGDTQVTLHLDKNIIHRIRTNSKNLYILNNQEFNAIGNSVPDEIQEVLKIDEINIQKQMDAPFILADTPGTVAAKFNELAGLEQIDTSLSYVQRQINQVKKRKDHLSENLKELRQELSRYNDLDTLIDQLQYIRNKEKQLIKLQDEKSKITFIITELQKISTRSMYLNNKVELETFINSMLSLYSKKKEILRKGKELRIISLQLHKTQARIQKLQLQVNLKSKVNTLLELLYNKQKSLISCNNLQKLYNTITDIEKRRKNVRNKVNELEGKFKTNFPPVCPLCGTNLEK